MHACERAQVVKLTLLAGVPGRSCEGCDLYPNSCPVVLRAPAASGRTARGGSQASAIPRGRLGFY